MMNLEGLSVEIWRCHDGVELVGLPAIEGPTSASSWSPITVFRYRTDRLQPQTLTICDLEDPVVIRFANATDDERRQLFFGQFGLDSFDGRIVWRHDRFWEHEGFPHLRHDDVIKIQSDVRRLLRQVGGEDPADAMKAINSTIAETKGFNLQPTFHLAGPRGAPRLLLKSDTLLGFMLMEMAMIVAHEARLSECEKCGTSFLTGTLTWRRSSARFCSDKCRVAANRAQRAAGT